MFVRCCFLRVSRAGNAENTESTWRRIVRRRMLPGAEPCVAGNQRLKLRLVGSKQWLGLGSAGCCGAFAMLVKFKPLLT